MSQELKTVIKDSFNNNINKWQISEKNHWKSNIVNGSFNISNIKSDEFAYFRTNNFNLKNKEKYDIEMNFKVSLLENQSSCGIIFINEESNTSGIFTLFAGYLINIAKFENDYYVDLNKYDQTGFNHYERIENFDTNKIHNLKILIDNSKPLVSIILDNKKIIEREFPLFNFDNIGFNLINKSTLIINDIIIKTGINENKRFMYDINDIVFDETNEKSYTLKGNNYSKELEKYVPRTLLIDDFKGDIFPFKEELMTNEKCYNFKTVPDKEGYNDIFSLYYKSNLIYTLVSKKNTFTTTAVIFKNPNDSLIFFNLYSKAKGFKIENERAYSPINEMKAIMLNKEKNSVTIFY